ncbi:MAG: 50S ribosomal protein L14e [Candidatus Altiarchaeales archaeon HGW-Altiarchaeales-1]|nr:MAG: 50S ribosomal protein L14e [Candidatus Altiarchaeales archaeon HGW-Altiarchaeales-1]
MILSIGRVCKKIKGRDAGKYCVVVDKAGKTVVVDGKGMKKSKSNIFHLVPMPVTIDITKNDNTETIVKKLAEAGIN